MVFFLSLLCSACKPSNTPPVPTGEIRDDPRLDEACFRNYKPQHDNPKGRGRGRGSGLGRGARAKRPRSPPPPSSVSGANTGNNETEMNGDPDTQSDTEAKSSTSSSDPESDSSESDACVVESDVAPQQPVNQPVRQQSAQQVEERDELPVPIQAKVKNQGHAEVIKTVLPVLRSVMLSPEWCRKDPRDQTRHALFLVDSQKKKFWGQNDLHTRKRTVEDLVLQFYYDELKALL